MKVLSLIKYTIITFTMFLVSCSDDFFNYDEIQEGIPASLIVNISSADNVEISRVGRDEEEEKKISNVYILLFDNTGNTIFCSSYNNINSNVIQIENINSTNNATLIGIANVGVSDYALSDDEIMNIKSLKQLDDLVVDIHNNTIERYNNFLMLGKVEGVNITAGTTAGKVDLVLYRVDAKIVFNVTSVAGNPDWKEFSFRPKTWIVKQVPTKTYLTEKFTGDYNDESAQYFQTKELAFEDIVRGDGSTYKGGSFTFYMPENRKIPSEYISESGKKEELYAMRDAWEKGENGERKFIYANSNSTYVEMTGLLSYKDESDKEVNADVRFIVHLGYASGNPNDYETKRSTCYTYTVTIKGIQDIETEVDGKIDGRPGYEGDVVYTEKQSFTFDSHYDRRLITMDPTLINDKVGISWSVNTPFSRGIYKIGSGEIPNDLKDYRWIKFAINKDYGVKDNSYVKYPGDQNYDDPYINDGTDNLPSPYYTKGNPYYGSSDGLDHSGARLLDINQLCERLKEEQQKPDVEPLAVTVFIDEYLYYKHPIYGTSDNGLSLWKLTTDKQERSLHLIVKDAQSSQDGNSSKVTAQFSFKQRTIQTVYNADNMDLTTAWGLESVMETGVMSPKGISQSANSTSNGRKNTLQSILGDNYSTNKNVKWTDILGTDDSYSLVGDQFAVRACLLRNRDLNGDNIVDANEIRWYLASIDQLTDIYLGEYALDEQSRLYPKEKAEKIEIWHYASSSYSRFDDGGWFGKDKSYIWKLWSEEGASRGEVDILSTTDEYAYRCVRNLGLPVDEADKISDDLVKISHSAEGYIIDLTNMNPRSLRSSAVIGNNLGKHNEREDENRPYVRFLVHNDVFPTPQNTGSWSNKKWNSNNWDYYQTHNPSPSGFRVPNQRELLIMSTRMPDNAWKEFSSNGKTTKPLYISYTSFSLNGKSGVDNSYNSERDGFIWNSDTGVFFLQNDEDDEKGYVRPVKDYVE